MESGEGDAFVSTSYSDTNHTDNDVDQSRLFEKFLVQQDLTVILQTTEQTTTTPKTMDCLFVGVTNIVEKKKDVRGL